MELAVTQTLVATNMQLFSLYIYIYIYIKKLRDVVLTWYIKTVDFVSREIEGQYIELASPRGIYIQTFHAFVLG